MRHLHLRNALLLVIGVGLAALVADIVRGRDPSAATDRLERIDAYVLGQMRDSRIPGVAMAIVEDGGIVHTRGFGHDGRGDAITAATPFWLGSNTKSFTALSVMQLAEAGAVDLDAPVQRYLPEFRAADAVASSRITVRHLLNQTSGFSRRDGLRMVAEGRDETLQEAVDGLRELELNRPVGESFEYSNPNFVVLGLLIERVTGEIWQDYVQANVFGPLRMTRSYTTLEEARAHGLTATHRNWFGFPVEAEPAYLRGLAPTGYLYASVGDMARYLSMYLQGGELEGRRVLSERGIAEMLSPSTDARVLRLQSQEFTARYGAGWFVGSFGAAQDARWHQGQLASFTAWMVLMPETNQAVVVLINAGNQFEIAGANGAWSRIPQGVVNVLRGETPPVGVGAVRFFIVFNTLVAAVLVTLVWSLARVASRPGPRITRDGSSARALAPLLWELGLAVALPAVFQTLTGGLGWRASFASVPDLTLVVLAVSGLLLLTGLTRVGRIALASGASAS